MLISTAADWDVRKSRGRRSSSLSVMSHCNKLRSQVSTLGLTQARSAVMPPVGHRVSAASYSLYPGLVSLLDSNSQSTMILTFADLQTPWRHKNTRHSSSTRAEKGEEQVKRKRCVYIYKAQYFRVVGKQSRRGFRPLNPKTSNKAGLCNVRKLERDVTVVRQEWQCEVEKSQRPEEWLTKYTCIMEEEWRKRAVLKSLQQNEGEMRS